VQGERGQIQFTSILTLLVVAAIGYLGYALLPAYADNYTLKQDLSGIANQGWRNMGQLAMQQAVIEKAQGIGSHIEIPTGGLPVQVKGLPVGEDETVVTCTDASHDCSGADGDVQITVTYTRIVALPYLKDKTVTLHFSPSVKESLHPVEW
jgi:hypothetical protein